MSLWGHLKKEGQLLGDISGINQVAHSVEHPLDWKGDLKSALVIGSYMLGPGAVARSAAGLAERLAASRVGEAAPAEVGSALHAAWGIPKMKSPSDPGIGEALKRILRTREVKRTNGAIPLPPASTTETKGIFFTPRVGQNGERAPYNAINQDEIAHRLTQASDPFTNSGLSARAPMTVSEPYNLGTAAQSGKLRVFDSSVPSAKRLQYGETTGERVSDSRPLGGMGHETSPNNDLFTVKNIAELYHQMGYQPSGLMNSSVNPVDLIKWLAKQKKITEDGLLGESGKIPKAPLLGGGVGYGALGYILAKALYDKTNN